MVPNPESHLRRAIDEVTALGQDDFTDSDVLEALINASRLVIGLAQELLDR